MSYTLPQLDGKQSRTLALALRQLFKSRSIKPIETIQDIEDLHFTRMLQINNKRMVRLTDSGFNNLKIIVEISHKVHPFGDLVAYRDVWEASSRALKLLLSDGVVCHDSNEWLNLIFDVLFKKIESRNFATPMVGVKFVGVDRVEFGVFSLIAPTVLNFPQLKIDDFKSDIQRVIDGYRDNEVWFVGRASGTLGVVREKIENLSDLFSGLLAVVIAVQLRSGATRLFVGAHKSSCNRLIMITWFSTTQNDGFQFHKDGVRKMSHAVEIDIEMQKYLQNSTEIATAIRIFESKNRTEMEEVLVRALHWYSEAHRDPILSMQFLKYWSCIEGFFSFDREKITKSVSIGVAAVLVYGGYDFYDESQYGNIRKRVSDLYDLRSRAVHEAELGHILEIDVVDISRYASRLLLNMLKFSELGYSSIRDIKQKTSEINARHQNQ